MEHKSDIQASDTRAAELATIVHEGREFASGGFFVDMERGRMVAYVSQDAEPPAGFPYEPRQLWLTTWNGEKIVRLARTGSARGFYGAKLECFETRVPWCGYYWHGRGLGIGMMLRLSRGRKA